MGEFVITGVPWGFQPHIVLPNKRVYSAKVIDEALVGVAEKVTSGGFFGNVMTMESPEEQTHRVTNMYRQQDQVFVDLVLLENSRGGQALRLYLESHPDVKLEAWPIGTGKLEKNEVGNDEVTEYSLNRVDLDIVGGRGEGLLYARLRAWADGIERRRPQKHADPVGWRCLVCGGESYDAAAKVCRTCNKETSALPMVRSDAEKGLIQAILAIEGGQFSDDGLEVSQNFGIGLLVELRAFLGCQVRLESEGMKSLVEEFEVKGWSEILRCARTGGWQPTGTEIAMDQSRAPWPLEDQREAWSGYSPMNYLASDGQLVGAKDVEGLQNSLKVRFPSVRPQEFKALVARFLTLLGEGPFRIF